MAAEREVILMAKRPDESAATVP